MSTSALPHFSLITHFPALFIDYRYTVSQHLEPVTYFSRVFFRFLISAFRLPVAFFPVLLDHVLFCGFDFTLILKQSYLCGKLRSRYVTWSFLDTDMGPLTLASTITPMSSPGLCSPGPDTRLDGLEHDNEMDTGKCIWPIGKIMLKSQVLPWCIIQWRSKITRRILVLNSSG